MVTTICAVAGLTFALLGRPAFDAAEIGARYADEIAGTLMRVGAPERRGLWGGATLRSGQAFWTQLGVGFDSDTQAVARVGYMRALGSHFDASAELDSTSGSAGGLGGAIRGRFGVIAGDRFHLAADAGLRIWSYRDGPVLWGGEGGIMGSSFVGRRWELFYGAAMRLYRADELQWGPQLKGGIDVSFGDVSCALAFDASRLMMTGTPATTVASGVLSVGFRFGH